MNKPPLLGEDKVTQSTILSKVLNVVMKEQHEVDVAWYEKEIDQVMKEDLLNAKKQVNKARSETIKEICTKIESKYIVRDGLVVITAEQWKSLRDEIEESEE